MWSIYNGATYYIDHYGKKFQKELEALKKDVAKWQNSPGGGLGPLTPGEGLGEQLKGMSAPEIDKIPALDGSTGAQFQGDGEAQVRERK